MPFNDIEKHRIKKIVGGFCQEQIPDHRRSQIKLFYEIKGYEVRIIESRPHFSNSHLWTDTPIARLQFDPDFLAWQLYWMRANGKWHKYPDLGPANNLKFLVDTIAEDRYRLFWG